MEDYNPPARFRDRLAKEEPIIGGRYFRPRNETKKKATTQVSAETSPDDQDVPVRVRE